MPEKLIGKITHFFGNLGVGVVELTGGELKVGDKIHVKGHKTDFEQEVVSLQIEKDKVDSIKAGESAGLKVDDKVKVNDEVYLVTEE